MTNEEFIKSITLDGEEWRDVVGYEGYYVVSNYGRIVRLAILTKAFATYTRMSNRKQIKPQYDSFGYPKIILSKKGVKKNFRVHRLVAEAFIPNPNNYPMIDHIDGNPRNNHVENLRWCDNKINMNNPIAKERISKAQTGVPLPKLYRPVVSINSDGVVTHYQSIKHASMQGFNRVGIINACKGVSKSCGGCTWMYLSDYENLINQNVNERLPN